MAFIENNMTNTHHSASLYQPSQIDGRFTRKELYIFLPQKLYFHCKSILVNNQYNPKFRNLNDLHPILNFQWHAEDHQTTLLLSEIENIQVTHQNQRLFSANYLYHKQRTGGQQNNGISFFQDIWPSGELQFSINTPQHFIKISGKIEQGKSSGSANHSTKIDVQRTNPQQEIDELRQQIRKELEQELTESLTQQLTEKLTKELTQQLTGTLTEQLRASITQELAQNSTSGSTE